MGNVCCKCGKQVYGVAQDTDKLFKEVCKGCYERLNNQKKPIETIDIIEKKEEKIVKKKLTNSMKKDTVIKKDTLGDEIELNPEYKA